METCSHFVTIPSPRCLGKSLSGIRETNPPVRTATPFVSSIYQEFCTPQTKCAPYAGRLIAPLTLIHVTPVAVARPEAESGFPGKLPALENATSMLAHTVRSCERPPTSTIASSRCDNESELKV